MTKEETKKAILGMSHGAANHKLKQTLIFDFVKKLQIIQLNYFSH